MNLIHEILTPSLEESECVVDVVVPRIEIFFFLSPTKRGIIMIGSHFVDHFIHGINAVVCGKNIVHQFFRAFIKPCPKRRIGHHFIHQWEFRICISMIWIKWILIISKSEIGVMNYKSELSVFVFVVWIALHDCPHFQVVEITDEIPVSSISMS